MADSNPIIDRNAFGHWLSGFTDGEGCFWLGAAQEKTKRNLVLRGFFQIALRRDDLAILEQIQQYWGAGHIAHPRVRKPRPNEKPSSRLRVVNIPQLMTIVIPHFTRYPLRAKKQRDFRIWSQGIEFLAELKYRKTRSTGRTVLPKHTDKDRAYFLSLVSQLREVRQYDNGADILDALPLKRRIDAIQLTLGLS